MENPFFVCPKCGGALSRSSKSFYCEKGHCYDVAAEGYVNLLSPDKRHSPSPGDSKEMVRSRYAFLEKGFYAPLAEKLCELINTYGVRDVLDAGCGSGYYSRYLLSKCTDCNVFAVDISKEAVKIGAKRGGAAYAVAGVYSLPFCDCAFDSVLNVFSPFAFEEYRRVLRENGLLFSVYPAPEHLIELKRFLYGESVYENNKNVEADGFDKIDVQRVKFNFDVDGADLKNLLAMTPYYFTSPPDKVEAVSRLEGLSLTADFEISVLKKR